MVVQSKGSGHEGIPFGKLESENCGEGDVLRGWVGERDGADVRRTGDAVSWLRQSTEIDGGFISSKLRWLGARQAETISNRWTLRGQSGGVVGNLGRREEEKQ